MQCSAMASVLDERIAILRRELNRKVQKVARRLQIKTRRVRVEADPRALTPYLPRFGHLEESLLEDRQLTLDAVLMLQLEKHRPEPTRASVDVQCLTRLL